MLNGVAPLYGKAVKALRDSGHLKDLKFPTPKQIAIEMLTAANGHESYDGADERYSAMIASITKVDDDIDYVAFPSINYETEIFKKEEGVVLVQTCNNQWDDWMVAIEKIKTKYPDAQIEIFDEGGEPDDLFSEEWNIWNSEDDNKNNPHFLHFNHLKMVREGKKVCFLHEDKFYKRS
jgi:hypothetical protein